MEGIRGDLVQHPFPLAGGLLVAGFFNQGVKLVGSGHLQQQPPSLHRPSQGLVHFEQSIGLVVTPDQLVFFIDLEVANGSRLQNAIQGVATAAERSQLLLMAGLTLHQLLNPPYRRRPISRLQGTD
jgi:hypothetical protein